MNIPAAESIYTTGYRDFKGVDFTSQICSRQRFPLGKNFIISDMVEKRPGWKALKNFEGLRINGIYLTKINIENEENSEIKSVPTEFYLIHAGDKLYSVTDFLTEPVLLLENINNAKSSGFYANNNYYILTGEEYIQFDGKECMVINEENYNKPYTDIGEHIHTDINGTKYEYTEINEKYGLSCVFKTPYVPVLYKGSDYFRSNQTTPEAGWTYESIILKTGIKRTSEEINLLSGWGAIEYPSLKVISRSDNTVWEGGYLLPDNAKSSTKCIIETADGATYIKYPINYYTHTILNSGTNEKKELLCVEILNEVYDAVENKPFKIYYQLNTTDNKIYKSTVSNYIQYGNGVYYFFTGNKAHPNRDWQSELNNPLYIKGDKYTIYGTEDEILGYGQYGEYLAVFKKGNIDTNIYIRSVQDLGELGIAFPTSIGVGGAVGGLSSHTIFNLDGETLYLTNQGIFALTSLSLTNMKVTRNRSFFVDGRLLKEENLQNAIACTWKQKYFLSINSKCYILDGSQAKKYVDSTNNEYAYECLFWDNIPATSFLSTKDKLYFGTEDGRICVFTEDSYKDDDTPVEMVISTVLDDDGDFMSLKKMKKKGTGILVKPYTKSSFDISFLYDTYAETYVKTAYADIFDFNDIDFERFTFETSENPRIIPFLKKSKKYKSIQIILKSSVPEPFGMIAIVKRFTFNNYIKRS